PHLLPDRLPQPHRRHARLGRGLLHLPAPRPPAAQPRAAPPPDRRGEAGGGRHPHCLSRLEMKSMRQGIATLVLTALAATCLAGRAAAQASASPAPPDVTDSNKPRTVPGFDPGAMDRAV